jgi:hypothetical protein
MQSKGKGCDADTSYEVHKTRLASLQRLMRAATVDQLFGNLRELIRRINQSYLQGSSAKAYLDSLLKMLT